TPKNPPPFGVGSLQKYGKEQRSVEAKGITVRYKTDHGMAEKNFTVYRTHHGPIVRDADGKWVSVRLMQEPVKALMQSYGRTKSTGLRSFRDVMELHTNSSNNTVFADAEGHIAYFHSNFIPRRNPKFDWTKPVDGSDPATEWNGVLAFEETPNVIDPASGWVYNTNNWPWTAAGPNSPKQANYPPYVERGGENPRGVHAIRVLENKKDFTLPALIAAAYDSYLPAFQQSIPTLVAAWGAKPAADPLKAKLSDEIVALKSWDLRWSTSSVATSLAVYWGEELGKAVAPAARKAGLPADEYALGRATADERLRALAAASDRLAADFGSWKTPWGNINRYQRLTG